MSRHEPPRGAGRGAKRGGAAVAVVLTPMLVLAAISVIDNLRSPSEATSLLVPLMAAIPLLVGCGLLLAGRNRQFALGLLIGSAVVLIIAPAACFTFVYVAFGG